MMEPAGHAATAGGYSRKGSPGGLNRTASQRASRPASAAWRRASPQEGRKGAGCPLANGYLAEPVSRFAPLLPRRAARVDVWGWEQVAAIGQRSVDRKEPLGAHVTVRPVIASQVIPCGTLRTALIIEYLAPD